jgi:hypothetical protein
MVKGPTADATDAPQSWGLLCNTVMKRIFFPCFLVMEHRWNEIDTGKPKYSGKKACPSAKDIVLLAQGPLGFNRHNIST